MQALPQGWIPEVTIIDGMFLYNRFAMEQFHQGVILRYVHIVGDEPSSQMPKLLVHMNTFNLPHIHLYPMLGESTLTAGNESAQ